MTEKTNSHSVIDELTEIIPNSGIDPALNLLSERFRAEKKYYELFEILKMQVRRNLGLALTHDQSTEELPEATQRKLEDGLFDACRDVGTLLMKEGHVSEGWTFLRPVGDKDLAKRLLEEIEVTDDNVDGIVEVALGEGVSPAYGFRIVLDRYGTCNSITSFDSEVARCEKDQQQMAAAMIVEQLHGELMENLAADIKRREEKEPHGETILGLVENRPELFEENTYHIDTSHLASVVRFARKLDDPDQLAEAIDLTEYGIRLSEQFQYEGDEPFGDIYPASRLYLRTLAGIDVEEGIKYFEEKARTQDVEYFGPVAIETYIDLLTRIGRIDDAISASLEFLPEGPRVGLALSLFELCRMKGDYSVMIDACREKEDLLGYAMAALHQAEQSANN